MTKHKEIKLTPDEEIAIYEFCTWLMKRGILQTTTKFIMDKYKSGEK